MTHHHPLLTERGPTKITNDDGSCRYRGCTKLASARRITRRGWFLIFYCAQHELEAHERFGDERFRAVA